MSNREMSAARAREIVKRQTPPRWGPRYIPGQRAVRGEKSGKSKASTIPSSLLQRDVHAIAGTEKPYLALALYNPKLFELKEQHALSLKPGDHPLVGHPKARGLILPTTTGTAAVAERLGLGNKHPRAREDLGPGAETPFRYIAAPMLRDLLLFLEDEAGPYCVDWDVKDRVGDHGMPGPSTWAKRTAPRTIENAQSIDAIYVEYMRELGIRVVRVAKEELDPMLVTNLLRLLKFHSQTIESAPHVQVELLEAYCEALAIGRPASLVMNDFIRAGVDPDECRRVLFQGIWYRKVRIDLFSGWMIDHPMTPERRDPLVVYGDLFKRCV